MFFSPFWLISRGHYIECNYNYKFEYYSTTKQLLWQKKFGKIEQIVQKVFFPLSFLYYFPYFPTHAPQARLKHSQENLF